MPAPEKIYLQWHGDAEPADYPDGSEPRGDDVTWCRDKIFDHDIAYVRADKAAALEAERDQAIRYSEQWREKTSAALAERDRLAAELEKADDRWRHAVERAELFCAESDRLAKALEEKEGDMHMRIRAGYDATVADCWHKENDGLRAELLGYQEEAQIHGKNIELRDTEITRLRAELTHEKCLREQAEAICVVLRAHREEYAAQVIEGHAEIANITADNKRLRAELEHVREERDSWRGGCDWRDAEIAGLRAELAEFQRIRELLIKSLMRATDYGRERIEEGPLTAAVAHAKSVAECRRDAERFKKLDALCVQSANACGRIWRIDLPAATFDFLLDIDAALAADGDAK